MALVVFDTFQILLRKAGRVLMGSFVVAYHTGQDQLVIGRAAVAAARMAEEGTAPAKFWILEQTDIVRLGRVEWKE